MSRYDVAIAYRIYPKVAECAQSLPFSDQKLHLSEVCLRSFKESLGGLCVKVWVLLDGCPDEYTSLFRKYFDPQDLILLPVPATGNRPTFGMQVEILLRQTESDLVYFAEDDYVYLPKSFPLMVEFLRAHGDVDFVSPYDHLDCYTLAIHRHPKLLRVHAGHHWRTAASTCLTFLTRKETLQRTQTAFLTYCRRNKDCSLWLSLTKHSLLNPIKFLRLAFQSPLFARIIAKAWFFGARQILFGKRMKLWVPIPGIATHLDRQALSPTIDWIALMKEQAEAIELESTKTMRVSRRAPMVSLPVKGTDAAIGAEK